MIIKNGQIIDGTGASAYNADVAIKDGKIVEVGQIDQPAAREVDANGLVVSPGFIDPHTHFDAQLLWDGRSQASYRTWRHNHRSRQLFTVTRALKS
jgi:N-acyl-D-aspartate/D-glutamate deacylase